MDHKLLACAIEEIKRAMHSAITTRHYGQGVKSSGHEAKTALIRSETLIQRIHEVTKVSLHDELTRRNISHVIHPPLQKRSPELNVWGFLKKKKQDVVVIFGDNEPSPERITEGPLAGEMDELGKSTTEHSIVVGVRSQLSSVAKNFDTLMERTFAETVNLRFRHPRLVMGEVYLLAIKDYDDEAMKEDEVVWKEQYNDIKKYISIFNAMNRRCDHEDMNEFYKYERCALLLVDFSREPAKIYKTIEELKKDEIVDSTFAQDYSSLSPLNFSKDLVDAFVKRQSV